MVVIKKGQAVNSSEIIAKLGLPVFVKPSSEGSSVGVFKVKTEAELQPAIEAALKFDNIVLVLGRGRILCTSVRWRSFTGRSSDSGRRVL